MAKIAMDLNTSKAEKVQGGLVYVHVGGEWIPKSRHVYSLAHPDYEWKKGDVFVFLDNDKRNFSPENVMKCTWEEMMAFHRLSKGVHDTEGGLLAFRQAQLRVAMLAAAEKRGLVKRVNGSLKACTENEELQKILDCGKRYREEHKEDARRYREEHKEDARRYREEHKEQIAERMRRYCEEHKEAINARRRARYNAKHGIQGMLIY